MKTKWSLQKSLQKKRSGEADWNEASKKVSRRGGVERQIKMKPPKVSRRRGVERQIDSWSMKMSKMSTSWASRTKVTTTEEWSLELNWPILYQKMLFWAKNPKKIWEGNSSKEPIQYSRKKNAHLSQKSKKIWEGNSDKEPIQYSTRRACHAPRWQRLHCKQQPGPGLIYPAV